MKKDNVNHPAHYTAGGIECIEAIKASMTPEEFRGYLKGNALKYLWRYQNKGKPQEDLQKAEWYLQRLINELQQEDPATFDCGHRTSCTEYLNEYRCDWGQEVRGFIMGDRQNGIVIGPESVDFFANGERVLQLKDDGGGLKLQK